MVRQRRGRTVLRLGDARIPAIAAASTTTATPAISGAAWGARMDLAMELEAAVGRSGASSLRPTSSHASQAGTPSTPTLRFEPRPLLTLLLPLELAMWANAKWPHSWPTPTMNPEVPYPLHASIRQ